MKRDERRLLQQIHQLSREQVGDAVSPLEVISFLNREMVHFILIGGHMLGLHTGRPRATVDVGVIVAQADVAKAATALAELSDLVYARGGQELQEFVKAVRKGHRAPL